MRYTANTYNDNGKRDLTFPFEGELDAALAWARDLASKLGRDVHLVEHTLFGHRWIIKIEAAVAQDVAPEIEAAITKLHNAEVEAVAEVIQLKTKAKGISWLWYAVPSGVVAIFGLIYILHHLGIF